MLGLRSHCTESVAPLTCLSHLPFPMSASAFRWLGPTQEQVAVRMEVRGQLVILRVCFCFMAAWGTLWLVLSVCPLRLLVYLRL